MENKTKTTKKDKKEIVLLSSIYKDAQTAFETGVISEALQVRFKENPRVAVLYELIANRQFLSYHINCTQGSWYLTRYRHHGILINTATVSIFTFSYEEYDCEVRPDFLTSPSVVLTNKKTGEQTILFEDYHAKPLKHQLKIGDTASRGVDCINLYNEEGKEIHIRLYTFVLAMHMGFRVLDTLGNYGKTVYVVHHKDGYKKAREAYLNGGKLHPDRFTNLELVGYFEHKEIHKELRRKAREAKKSKAA